MDLVKKNIHMDYTKASVVSQLVLEEDINLSDTKPDINCICLEKGAVIIDEVKPYNDSVIVRGRLVFAVLYHTDEEDRSLAVMEGKLPFEEKVNVQGLDSGDTVKAEGCVEDLSVGIINSRKLSIQSVVNLDIRAEGIYDEEVPIALSGPQKAEYRKKPMEVAQIAVCKNDIFRIREEISLPSNYPNLFRILWSTLIPDDVEIRPLEEKLSIQGELRILLIYECDEGRVHSLETSVPINGTIECHGCRDHMIPDITCHMGQQELNIRPDNDGEERMISLEAMLELKLKLYEETTVEIITDVYGVKNEVSTMEKEASLKRLLTRTNVKHKLAEHVRISDKNSNILQLMHCEGSVHQDTVQVSENMVSAKGMVQLQILYISTDDGKPYDVLKAGIPYKYDMEIPGIQTQDIYEVQADLEQLQVTILDGEELDVKAVLAFHIIVFRKQDCNLISGISAAAPDTKKLASLPGMAVYVVKPGDNLWSIGKKYYLPVERIKKLNDLTGEELRPGQKLLLVKAGF